MCKGPEMGGGLGFLVCLRGRERQERRSEATEVRGQAGGMGPGLGLPE